MAPKALEKYQITLVVPLMLPALLFFLHSFFGPRLFRGCIAHVLCGSWQLTWHGLIALSRKAPIKTRTLD